MDTQLRDLERKMIQGDQEAKEKYEAVLQRLGLESSKMIVKWEGGETMTLFYHAMVT